MLRLYYGNAGENKYVSVGYFPMSTYIRHEIANQTTDSNHGWTSGASLVEVTAKPGSDAKEFLTTYGDHPLYIDIEHTKQIDGIILKTEYFTSHQATMMLIWNGRTLYNFRFWDNWGTTSLMSPFSSPDDLASNDEEWKYFINKMFEIESEQVNWTKAPLSYTYGNGLCDTPLLAPFIPAEISFSAGILSGWYYNANFRFPGINILSAATWATAYLGYPAIQVSTMYDKSGNEFYPCVAYNPLHWNADAFTAAKKASDGRVHAYGFESGDDAKSDTKGEIRYQSNNDIPVINNAVNSDLTISFQDKTIVQTAQFKLLYVQAGTQFITYGQATSKLDVVRTGEWVGLKYSMINRANDEDSYGYVGMVSVIQLTDSNSLKNMAIKYKDSTDFFKIHSTQYADTPYIGIFQLFHSRNNGWEDDYNMMFLWATQLSGEASNNISGQEILDTFYKSSEEPDDPIIVTEDASNTIPPDKDGAGGTSGDKHTGGDGTWDNSSQDTSVNADGEIDEDKIAPAPTGMYGGVDNGVTTVKLNSAQFNTLCDLLWDESFLSNVSQIFGLDAIKNAVGNIKYGNIEIPSAGETKIKKIAGYTLQSAAGGTGPIGCNKINQYNRYSFGKLSVPKYFGSFLDYAPYTQINLVLPFASSSINIPIS